MPSPFRHFLPPALIGLGLAASFALAQTPPAPKAPTAPAPAAPPAPAAAAAGGVVARADGITITEADLAMAADDPALSLPGMSDAQKRDLLVSYMVDLKLGA